MLVALWVATHAALTPCRLSNPRMSAAPVSAAPAKSRADAAFDELTWRVAAFDELTVCELYDVLELRQRIFVLEQTCLFPDIDGADQRFLHLIAYDGDKLVGYTRMGDVGTSYPEALTVGRVIVAPSHRGAGLSYPLMRRSIDAVRARYGRHLPVIIGAQAHLQRLYTRLGFVASSEEYDEDGIPHIDMTLPQGEAVGSFSSTSSEE